jgi:transcriptional regulator with XRE-family HTH domain
MFRGQLGEKNKYIRKTNQMSQKEFGDRIGVSQGRYPKKHYQNE